MSASARVGRGHERLRTPDAGNTSMARAEKIRNGLYQGAPSPWFTLELIQRRRSCRRGIGRRPQFGDQPQDLCKQHPRHGNLGHLEGDIAAVADDLRPDLDQLLLQAGQRPVLDRLGRRQRTKEIAEIVGERVKLETDGIGRERPA